MPPFFGGKQMDITFKTEEGNFNYRVCAVILWDGKLLAMQDERSPYYYLPGGRVQLHETMEAAVVREVWEELGVQARIQRPLWLNQGFFVEDVSKEKYHELCLYCLMNISDTDLCTRGEQFSRCEGSRTHRFQWLPIAELEDKYLYPVFIKKKIWDLPDQLTLQAEFE